MKGRAPLDVFRRQGLPSGVEEAFEGDERVLGEGLGAALTDPSGGGLKVGPQVGSFVCWAPMRAVTGVELDVIAAMRRSKSDVRRSHGPAAAVRDHAADVVSQFDRLEPCS